MSPNPIVSLSATESLIDRLLQSPQFGEHWARMWLDLARYADTKGYEKDLGRTIWPYRDWVISNVIVDTLKGFDMKYPQPEGNLDGIVIK